MSRHAPPVAARQRQFALKNFTGQWLCVQHGRPYLRGRTAGGRGVYAALDAVGGATTQLVTSAVRPGGTVLIYGALSGPTLTLNTFDIFLRKRLEVRARARPHRCSRTRGKPACSELSWRPSPC
jgi:threonine dehydrogenase-like Zn-dependent dehydrogenase